MLHVIVAKHGPDVCPASVPEARAKFLPQVQRIPEVAGQLGISMQGSWADMPGHTIFMVIDAPHAHAVSQFAMETHLMDWNTVEVHPVVSMEEAAEKAGARDI